MKKIFLIALGLLLPSCSISTMFLTELEPVPEWWDELAQEWTVHEYFYWIVIETEYKEEHGLVNDWKSPKRFINDGGGDCEDYVIMALFFLHEYRGVPKDDLRLAIGQLPDGTSHAVLLWEHKLIEAQTGAPASPIDDILVWSYNKAMDFAIWDQ